jgi:hypothetical protein
VIAKFVDYRSQLNSSEFPANLLDRYRQFPAASTDFNVLRPEASSPSPAFFSFGGDVQQQDAFRAELIDKPLANKAPLGRHSFLLVGGAVKLDGMRYVQAIMDGVEVHYSGGPVILKDVVFVNCKFVFDNVPNARTLADDVLGSTHLDVSIG